MLSYNEITPRKLIIHEDEPWMVLESTVSRKQANKPVNRTRLKNSISGRVIDYTFHVSDKVHEADVNTDQIRYLYTDKHGEIWFDMANDPKNRFALPESTVGDEIKYILEKQILDARFWVNKNGEEQIIAIRYPQKVELRVTEAPPNIKGDSATAGNKIVTLETGAKVGAPLFINVDDIIEVNTETGAYSSRIEKA